jgi:hypothetical protein
VKAKLDSLREETGGVAFDLNSTLSDTEVRVTKQIREELRRGNGKANGPSRANSVAIGDGGAR